MIPMIRLDSSTAFTNEELRSLTESARAHAEKVLEKQWLRYTSNPDCYYDDKSAQAAVDFFPRFIRHSRGTLKGKPFILEPWQEKLVRIIWGFKWKSNHLRVVRRLFLFIAKKNGKSTFCAGLVLLLLAGDGEERAEIFGAATTKKQASIVFDEAKEMVAASPELAARCAVYKQSIYYTPLKSGYQVISKLADDQDGANLHAFVIDELHRQKDRKLYDVLKHGTVARPQSLQIFMTTAGENKRSICGEVYEDAKKILRGEVDDIEFLPVIFEPEKDDDWKDPLTWAKANPSLGVEGAVRPDALLSDAREAMRKPRNLNAFLRLHCNRWTTALAIWIPPDVWAQCAGEVPWQKLPELLAGKTCFGGIDLASSQDITAWVKVFIPQDGDPNWWIVPRFYIPGDNLPERVDKSQVEYDLWAKQEALILTPGNRMDFDHIVADVESDAKKYMIEEIPYDRFQASVIAPRMNGMGLPMVEYPNNFAGMSAPTKLFEAFCHQKKLRHGGHPVLDWMVGNVVLQENHKEDVFPSKKKSAEKIDGVVASIMGLGRATTKPIEQKPGAIGGVFV
jgi:phage terminase large subunit-like protein